MKITGFDWDFRNINHIARHNVQPEEAEEVFFNAPLFRKTREGLRVALGRTDDGRYLFVVFAIKPDGKVRVVTARDKSDAERRYYRKEKG